MKLCIGTAQFGMDYGIRGQKKPALSACVEMLDYAVQNGVDSIDTARAYGTAEEVVGEFIKKKTIPRNKLEIISKFPPNILDDVDPENYYDAIKKEIERTFSTLNTDYLDGYLFHSARYVYHAPMLAAMALLEKEGLVRETGVSVYEPKQAKAGLKNPHVHLLQFPYSIFDQRMLETGVFSMAEEMSDTVVDIRSVFIQGLILMQQEEVPLFLHRAKPILAKLDELCLLYGYTRIELALCFAKNQKKINRVVVGVDDMAQLKEDIRVFEKTIPSVQMDEITKEFSQVDADIVMPSLWHKDG